MIKTQSEKLFSIRNHMEFFTPNIIRLFLTNDNFTIKKHNNTREEVILVILNIKTKKRFYLNKNSFINKIFIIKEFEKFLTSKYSGI